ncbi:ribosomal protein L6 (apicoplast) [Theileria orientalis]|uniref:Ribosomal protein L6 n=1 Tax=Theileria orientalis TaxID=68886 RepID=A0A976SJX1_THEOR|nr:ribosomal protein L6 [Theileria orientalis]
MLCKIKMIKNKNKITLIIDKCTNLLYTSIHNIKLILFVNKFICKLININKKLLNFITLNNKFTSQFNKILIKALKFLNTLHSINIVINRIHYRSVLLENKLIIKIGNLNNIIIYIPDIKKLNIHLSKKNDLISLSCKNEIYLTNLSSLIKNTKKIDRCTGVGMHYDNEKIIFKRKITNDTKN